MSVISLNEQNFRELVLDADRPVLVDFFATWCGPCRMMSPLVDRIAEEHPEYRVCKIDVDEQNELAQRFEIMSIPTLIVFRNGQPVARQIGSCSESTLLDMLAK